MIVKNEEKVLARCLESVRGVVDEIIIVDTGSTDKTVAIARKFTRKIYHFEWIDDFSAARNYAFSRATGDYFMWLDADDILTAENAAKLVALKENEIEKFDQIVMKYDLGGGFYSSRERIFRRATNPVWQDPIHEFITIQGKVLQIDACVTHMPPDKKAQSTRNIDIYEKNLARGMRLSPRGMYYYARELKEHGRIKEAVKYFTEFLDDGNGWVEDNIEACAMLGVCFTALDDRGAAFMALQRSFTYDAPRAKVCCLIGYYYKEKGDFTMAVNWFMTALYLPARTELGFVVRDFCDYIPAIELAVCYDKLGMWERAEYYNEIAGKAKPQSEQYLYNKNYFAKRQK